MSFHLTFIIITGVIGVNGDFGSQSMVQLIVGEGLEKLGDKCIRKINGGFVRPIW